MGKVNKLLREKNGRPTSQHICRAETTENYWTAEYA